MNNSKYTYISAFSFLIALSNSPVAFGQFITFEPAPTLTTTTVSTTDPVLAPAPAPAPELATAPVVTSTAINGSVDEAHGEGFGKKKGNDKGKGNDLIMSGTISGNTLNVTSITSGHLEIGTILSGDGIPQAVKIVAFGTGKGGVGTYTISKK